MVDEIGVERMNLKGRLIKILGNFEDTKGKTDVSIYAKISNLRRFGWHMSLGLKCHRGDR